MGLSLLLCVVCLFSVSYDLLANYTELSSACDWYDGCVFLHLDEKTKLLLGRLHNPGGTGTQFSAACSSNNDCMFVFSWMWRWCVKEICWLICAGMSDDWMIYGSKLYDKRIFKQKEHDHMLCLCHVHICACEWVIFVCVERMRKESMWIDVSTVCVRVRGEGVKCGGMWSYE